MTDESSNQMTPSDDGPALQARRLFLRSLGKWSGAAITATIAAGWLAGAPRAQAGAWINRRGGGGGGWINRHGGGGGAWVNGGGGGWVNRYGGGGGGWVNRYGGGGSAAWVNRW